MKKTFIIILILIIVVITAFTTWYIQTSKIKQEITNYNLEYESLYSNGTLNGVNLTTVINKAINNNEKYSIKKDENDVYINDNNNYIEIYVKLTQDGENYPMEAIEKVRAFRIYKTLWFFKF